MAERLRIVFVLVAVWCCVFVTYGQNSDVFIRDVGVRIDNSSTSFGGGFYDESNGYLLVLGEVSFVNLKQNEVVLSSGSNYLNASFNFLGRADTYVDVSGVVLRDVELNLVDADLFLKGNFSVSRELSLFRGRVLDDGDAVVTVANVSEAAVVFNDVSDNASYLAVKLKRALVSGGEYCYPIGDNDVYHPLKLSGLSIDGELQVSYSSDLDDRYIDANASSAYVFPSSGGWLVEDGGFPVKFQVEMSLFDDKGVVLPGKQALLYVGDPLMYTDDQSINRELKLDETYYTGSEEFYSAGLFYLMESDFGLNREKSLLSLPNLLVVTGASNPCFIIPEMSEYQNIDIKVYDSWGRLIFESKNYASDFRGGDYPNGTYYYYLSAVLNDGSKIEKNDIIEIVRAEK